MSVIVFLRHFEISFNYKISIPKTIFTKGHMAMCILFLKRKFQGTRKSPTTSLKFITICTVGSFILKLKTLFSVNTKNITRRDKYFNTCYLAV